MSSGMLRSHGDYGKKALIQLFFFVMVIVAVYPLFWMIITSFKTQEAYLANKYNLPWPIMLKNIISSFRGGKFARWFLNSILVTFGATLVTTVLACFAAYAFARMPFKGSNTILNFIIALMVVPPVVMIVPLFILYNQFKLHSTYHGIILLYTGITQPFSVYLLTNFFKTIPRDMVEAAMIDGCSKLGILFRIFIPLSRAALVTLFITQALWIWNELLIALIFLAKDEMRTLMVGITAFRTKYMLDIPVIMAGLLMSTLPMLILYALFQKAFIKGLTEGSTKG